MPNVSPSLSPLIKPRRRVCMISFHTCPLASQEGKESGGMNVYVLELAKQLCAQGHTVDIYTRTQEVNNNGVVQVAERLRVIHLMAGSHYQLPKNQLLTVSDDFVVSFTKFIQDNVLEYDILHCHYYLSGFIGLQIKQALDWSTPLVFTFHTLALIKNLVARSTSEQETPERISNELLLGSKVDAIISPSENEREYLTHLYGVAPRKINIVPPGVDLNLFKPMSKATAKNKIGADLNHKIILFAGRIEPLKGIDSILYATRILLSKSPELAPLCVWIVGGDVSQPKYLWSDELKRLEKLRAQLGLTFYVHFAGQNKQEDLPYFYNAAEVVVMPSHYESFGMAAAESLACGTPVITTNLTGISNLFDNKHQHLITSANNPLLLAKLMEQILSGASTHSAAQLRETVADLDWSSTAAKVVKVYDDLLPTK